MTKRTNDSWLTDLRADGDVQAAALEELRATLLGGLPYALSGWLSPNDPAFAPLAEEVTQEALLKILDNLHTFEGRSQFTTWAHKIAVNLALSKLRRRRWTDVCWRAHGENDSGRLIPG
jgi:RNA polymerase sigma-70 factor (ECF subfamily)